ncbi:UNVERIFIED_CONTAM: hypothetical protein Scaly_2236000 [Sesamum calycinum]|uniref:ATP-dependent DNA helicase n=1 Tax=Sesamum calycinum TaxID=2727403 RepID=A0AAW2M9D2_9LAMI
MLVIFDEDDKLNTPDDYDYVVRAEIPKQDEEPELYVAVIRHMIHGPCGHIKPNAPCMKNGMCKKGYPKQFAECTMQGNDSYTIYRRWNANRSIALDNDGDVVIDNSWAVPYNPWLLLKYDYHINVKEENYSYMIEDYPSSSSSSSSFVLNKLLHDLNGILMQHKRSINEFDLPQITEGFENLTNISGLIEHELSIPISETDLNVVHLLNDSQFSAFDVISRAIRRKYCAIFFVDGPSGTGKTFLCKSLLANFRKDGLIMLAIATSGIAAILLPSGRTTHSKLKIPIKFEPLSMCRFSKQSELSTLIERASAIIWDEALMGNRKAFETVDRTLRDILGVDLPFGGKAMILGRDFRQVVPVVIGGAKSEIINASIVQSPLWSNVKLLHLSENMKAQNDEVFSDFLLRIGNSDEPIIEGDMIRIPDFMPIPWEVADDARNRYLPEFFNSLSTGSLPPHKLTLKRRSSIMLFRNIDPKIGLCNGTRLICHQFDRNIIEAEILAGQFKGMRAFLPRIPLKSAKDANIPFEMTRRQFPVRQSFALTINKSQGQTIHNVGIYLGSHVFSHGQLYVAPSRGVSERTTKVLVRKGSVVGHEGVYDKNVVFKEIFAKLQSSLTITQGGR